MFQVTKKTSNLNVFFKQNTVQLKIHEDLSNSESPEKKEIDLEIREPSPEACKPKIRAVIKPSRPSTAVANDKILVTQPKKADGKVSRRLRSLVADHQDIPM